MKKSFLILAAFGLAMACSKSSTTTAKCSDCTVGTYTASYCEGDSILIVKNNGVKFQQVSYKVSLDSFKNYAKKNYGMTCN